MDAKVKKNEIIRPEIRPWDWLKEELNSLFIIAFVGSLQMQIDESGVEEQRKSVLPQPSAGSLQFNITWWHFIGLKTALAEEGQRNGLRRHYIHHWWLNPWCHLHSWEHKASVPATRHFLVASIYFVSFPFHISSLLFPITFCFSFIQFWHGQPRSHILP